MRNRLSMNLIVETTELNDYVGGMREKKETKWPQRFFSWIIGRVELSSNEI